MNPQKWEQAPWIGITTAYKAGKQILDFCYIQAIETAGGIPLIIPIVKSTDALQTLTAGLDGLVIVGGPAIALGLVGDLPDDINLTDPMRIGSDKNVLELFIECEKPILGICYGMQLLNAQTGGKLYADIERQVPGALNHSHIRGAGLHSIEIKPGSRLHRIMGINHLEVNTMHIQAIAELGEGFHATAAAPDGVIEAIEHRNGRFMGVQFHPERMLDCMQPLFDDFIRFCHYL